MYPFPTGCTLDICGVMMRHDLPNRSLWRYLIVRVCSPRDNTHNVVLFSPAPLRQGTRHGTCRAEASRASPLQGRYDASEVCKGQFNDGVLTSRIIQCVVNVADALQ